MSEMVERVSDIIESAMIASGGCIALEDLSRKILLAIREPTDQMLIKGLVAGHQENKPAVERMKTLDDYSWIAADLVAGDGRIYKAAYRAMIDATLGK